MLQVKLPYHIRVLVPCYKEPADMVIRTLEVRGSSPRMRCALLIFKAACTS